MASAIVPGTAIAIPASGIEEAEPNAGDTQESAEAAQEAQCEDACAQKAFNDAAQAERDARDVYGKILPHETTGLNYSERIASATQDKIKAQNAMDLYWNELAAQEEALKAARDNLANAQAFLAATQPPHTTKANASQGSLGFFEWLASVDGNQEAAKLLNDPSLTGTDKYTSRTFLSFTSIGADDDATSLENVRKAIEHIKECNDLRESDPQCPGLQPLRLNTFLMALGEVNANWTMTSGITSANYAHAVYAGEASYANENIAGSFMLSTYDPFDGWYTAERQHHLKKDGTNIKHYQNIVNGEFQTTGFGVNTAESGATGKYLDHRYAQEFGRETTHGVDYTYDEFKALFDVYCAVAMNRPDAAAQSRLAALFSNKLTNAQQEYDAAKSDRDAVGRKMELAQECYDVADKTLRALVNKKDATQTVAQFLNARISKAELDQSSLKSRLGRTAALQSELFQAA